MRVARVRISWGLCPTVLFALFAACGGANDSLMEPSGSGDASTSTGGTTSSTACARTADCSSRTDGNVVCDPRLQQCVQCASEDDCPASRSCVRNLCVPTVICQDSLACGPNLVCDTAIQRCVECVGDNDCAGDLRCAGGLCRLPCVTDKQCTPDGLVCNISAGACVECVGDAQCSGTDVCMAGTCSRPVTPGTGGTTGSGGTVTTGGTIGSGGIVLASGGFVGTGGAIVAGGSPATGGIAGTGGGLGTGGGASTGGAIGSGGSGTGGSGTGGSGPGCGSRLDMWIVADVSGSTGTAYDTGTKWDLEKAGIQGFVNSKTGIGVGMIFAPGGSGTSCCVDADCASVGGTCAGSLIYLPSPPVCLVYGTCGGCAGTSYVPADVPLTLLPDTGGVIAAALNAHGAAGTSVATGPLDGARQSAISSYNFGGRTVLVLIADGDPSACSDSWTSVGSMIQTAATGTPPLPTFIITLGWDPSAAVLAAAQMAGTTPIAIPSNLTLAGATNAMTNALHQIASTACQ